MMKAPLTGQGFGDEAEQSNGPTQPLPQELRDRLWRLLLGHRGDGDAARLRQARLAGGTTALFGWCATYTFFRALTIAGAEEVGFAAAVVVGVAFGMIIPLFGGYLFFLNAVPHVQVQLEAPLTPKGASVLAKLAKGWVAYRAFMIVASMAVMALVASESAPEAPYQSAAAIVSVALAPVQAVVMVTSLLGGGIPFVMAEDQLAQLVMDVRGATAATADYGAFTTGVYRAHTDMSRLSARSKSGILASSAFFFIMTVLMMYAGLGPRPPKGPEWWGAGGWYNFFLNEYLCVMISTIYAGIGVYNLMSAAKVTSACQRVANAVNDLRVTAKADGTAELATAEELHRIEGLKRYINELNRDQGLGFVLLRKKITFTFV
eukprot:SAG22_NODE_1280_length_4899_cov_5.374792_2_plen_376_part_00